MSNQLFDLDISGIVSDALSGNLLPATVTRHSAADYDPVNDTETSPADTNYTTEGIVTDYSKKLIAGGLVQENDHKILLLAEDLGIDPAPGDEITIEGKTYKIVGTPERDPAGATWIIRGRL